VIRMLDRYGSAITEITGLVDERPELAVPLQGAPAYLRAEIAHGCTHEGALHLEDLFDVRTRLTWEAPNHGLDAVEEIADLAAEALGWDQARRDAEVRAYRARCEAQDAAATIADEPTAAAVRSEVPGVVEAVARTVG